LAANNLLRVGVLQVQQRPGQLVHHRHPAKQSKPLAIHRSVDLDLDLAFQDNPDPGFWWTKTDGKNYHWYFFLSFLIKTFNLLIPRPP
jgi:hypothetical protein